MTERCFICEGGTRPEVLCEHHAAAQRHRDKKKTKSRRRSFYALYRRVAWLDIKIAEKENRGEDDSRLKAERSALRWAVEELSKHYPEEGRKALEDVTRALRDG